jgi:hypothetical protein
MMSGLADIRGSRDSSVGKIYPVISIFRDSNCNFGYELLPRLQQETITIHKNKSGANRLGMARVAGSRRSHRHQQSFRRGIVKTHFEAFLRLTALANSYQLMSAQLAA